MWKWEIICRYFVGLRGANGGRNSQLRKLPTEGSLGAHGVLGQMNFAGKQNPVIISILF